MELGETELGASDFESGFGNWTTANSSPTNAILSSSYAQGTQSVLLRDNTGDNSAIWLQNPLDLSGYDSMKIEFSYLCRSFEGSEDFWVLVSNDGGATWTNVATYVVGVDFAYGTTNDWVIGETVVVTDSSMALTDNMLVKFQCDATGTGDYVYIDDIRISGFVLDPSLIAWWEFNEDGAADTANTVDDTLGTLGGDAYMAAGRLYILTNGWVDAANSVSNLASQLSDEVTVSIWAWGSSSLPASTTIIRANDSGGDRVLNVHLPWATGKVYWDAPLVANRLVYLSSEAEFEGVWSHWSFTKDAVSGAMIIYLNGVNVAEESSGNTYTLGGIVSLVLGATDTSGAYSYRGTIADMRIYNRVLSATEIAALAAQPISELTD